MTNPGASVTASAPGKVNLALYVGSPDLSGFHPLLTAFQAVDMWERVTVEPAEAMSLECVADFDTASVPRDTTNIAWRAYQLLSDRVSAGGAVTITIDKSVPIAGGMAGGSADAAATLVALNSLWGVESSADALYDLARQLGSDVPFSLVGGAAVGRGRGDVLQSISAQNPLHFVIVQSGLQLSTKTVYQTLDSLRGSQKVTIPDHLSDEFVSAWKSGDAQALAPVMHNDLEQAAMAIEPSLVELLERVRQSGALRAMVSGSGPTVMGLADSALHATEIARRLNELGIAATATMSTPEGTRVQAR